MAILQNLYTSPSVALEQMFKRYRTSLLNLEEEKTLGAADLAVLTETRAALVGEQTNANKELLEIKKNEKPNPSPDVPSVGGTISLSTSTDGKKRILELPIDSVIRLTIDLTA